MKKIVLIILATISVLSCSTDDNSENKTPEFYNVKYQVIGTGDASRIAYSISDGNTESIDWVNLPFTKEIRLRTELDEQGTISGYKTISFRVYGDTQVSNIEEIRIYVDGELVCSNTDGPEKPQDYNVYPWTCHFDYLIREL
tara:strand:+ start:967 stop:1392 length:426 start_codon:yes stop_codon:yes gene_type:complete